jgi:hypothetical protein
MSLISSASAAPGATFPMDSGEYRHARTRGTILVASTNSAWTGVIGEMVVASGFTPAYPEEEETPWLVVTRTRPCIAICDCDVPVDRIQRLVLEAWAHHVPVLVTATGRSIYARSLKPKRVARFRLPVSPKAFRSLLERLLAPVAQSDPAGDDEPNGSRDTAAVGTHGKPAVRRDARRPGHRTSARVSSSDTADNARADDDGMAGSDAVHGGRAI